MPSGLYIDNITVIDHRLHVAVGRGDFSEGYEYVKRRDSRRCCLKVRDVRLNGSTYLSEFIVFKLVYTRLGSKDKIFLFLELRRYVSLVVDESLFSDVIVRHFVYHAFADIDIVAEYFVVSDFECLDAGPLLLGILKPGDPGLCT